MQLPPQSARILPPDSPATQQLRTTGQKTIGSEMQSDLLMMGVKDTRNMLRNNWLPVNHYSLHLVGLAFFYYSVFTVGHFLNFL